MSDRLSVDMHCQLLVDVMRDRTNEISSFFRNYTAMITTLVGGCVALRLQFADRDFASYANTANALATLMWLVTTIGIVDNMRSWWEYRQKYSEIAGIDVDGDRVVKYPNFWKSSRVEFTMLLVVFITYILFLLFNPLRSR